MAKERLKSPRARLFVALDLPDAMREGIVSWGRRELRDPALRVVPRESLHITLAFLGYRPEKEIERIAEGQRFTTKLLSERASASALPAATSEPARHRTPH